MANFTVRVELYGSPSAEEYEKLHAAMGKENFTRTITWEGDDNTYQMPHAEYNRGDEKLTTAQIRDSAVAAASTVWKDFSVLATKADGGRSMHNLKKA